ncbi:MFS general substrate transporter [Apiospora phragmitis]|uniref:MFS general substrate transporter n=1 Tax=Apiospora phragmitis TaxID=2905665 RepID=A0ABR1TX13_9PEZI
MKETIQREKPAIGSDGAALANQISATPPAADIGEFKEVVTAVLTVGILNMHTWGLNSTYSVFLAYYLNSKDPNFSTASPIVYAFIGGLSISIALLLSPLATALVGWKPMGTNKTIFVGAILETASYIGASFTTKIWHLVLSQGVAFGAGMGLIFTTAIPVTAQWFTERRSLANALAASGSGFGGLTYYLAANAMIAKIGLPWTFRVLAIVCFVVNSLGALVIRDRNKAVGSVHVVLNFKLLKRPSFLLFQGWLVFSIIPYIALVFSIVDYSRRMGLTASQASLVGAMFNLAQGIGRPLVGLSSDIFGRINACTFATGLSGLYCLFVWIFAAKSLVACIVFALLSGTVAGTLWAVVAPVCAEVVGLQLIPSALSISWLVLVLPSTFAEVIALGLRKPGPRGYVDVQVFIGVMFMGACMFSWLLRGWKVQELRKAHLSKEERENAVLDDDIVQSHSPDSNDSSDRDSDTPSRIGYFKALFAYEKV